MHIDIISKVNTKLMIENKFLTEINIIFILMTWL